jgi:uncharacterized radical SAM protein YgiQ
MILNDFLPVSKADMEKLGWEKLDFIIVTGDAYIDHPSFGTAVIGRVLLDAGYKVGVISQPNWRNTDDIKKLGRPRLGFLVNSGNIDSMVNHYTVGKKLRKSDNFSPGGKMDLRPNRAVIVYSNLIRQAFKKAPIILGGIEASLRRFAHYDYWDNKVRRSILIDTEADLLIYGMGEKQVLEIANYMNEGIDIKYINHVPCTFFITDELSNVYDYKSIPSYNEVCDSKIKYCEAFNHQYDEQDPIRGKALVQPHGDRYLVQNSPMMPLNREELDWVHGLSFMRNYHPSYEAMGGVPAIREVKFSIISERGCFGSCSFCALTFHQGRIVQSRSHDSIIDEAIKITKEVEFKGYIHDVGGPTANFRAPSCKKQLKYGTCKNKQCLHPKPCKDLDVDHTDLMSLLKKLREIDKVKKVFIRSGLRYDYIMADKNDKFFEEFCMHNISGQLKVAPEHIDEFVLDKMGKPAGKTYDQFVKKFNATNKKINKEQYIVPYLMSSHPGSTLKSAIKLAEYLRDIKYQPEQVQDFYPTPGTLSTTMYYTEMDPRTLESVYVPKSYEEKSMQRALLQFGRPWNYDLVYKALIKADRRDLIGNGPKCLIRDKNDAHAGSKPYKKNSGNGKKRNEDSNKKYDKKPRAKASDASGRRPKKKK